MKKVADLCVKVGTYEKDGQTKNRYVNIGSKMENDDGGSFFLLNRTFNPAGVPNPDNRDSVIVSVFERKNDAPQSSGTQQVVSPEDIIFQE